MNTTAFEMPAVMDLGRLKAEVLDGPPENALPCNLSDYWLHQVGESLERVLEHPGEESEKYMAGPLALIIRILFGKAGGNEMVVADEDLFAHFQDYRIEVALEEVNRKTSIKSTSATIETIFTNRAVKSRHGT